jgi:hypothetical protein
MLIVIIAAAISSREFGNRDLGSGDQVGDMMRVARISRRCRQ